MYGLFIGTTVSSFVLFIFRIIPINTIGMIIILYMYAVVGGITGYIIHNMIKKDISSNKADIKRDENHKPKQDNNPIPKKQTKKEIPKNNPTSKKVNYEKVITNISDLRKSSNIIKNLVKTRKEIDKMKKESNSILEDSVKKIEKRWQGH
jgi:hypothetical protein